jgi:hypothetical protein
LKPYFPGIQARQMPGLRQCERRAGRRGGRPPPRGTPERRAAGGATHGESPSPSRTGVALCVWKARTRRAFQTPQRCSATDTRACVAQAAGRWKAWSVGWLLAARAGRRRPPRSIGVLAKERRPYLRRAVAVVAGTQPGRCQGAGFCGLPSGRAREREVPTVKHDAPRKARGKGRLRLWRLFTP